MDYAQLSELANTVIQTAVIPLVAVLWQINGRLSKIEGKLEVIEERHDK